MSMVNFVRMITDNFCPCQGKKNSEYAVRFSVVLEVQWQSFWFTVVIIFVVLLYANMGAFS